MGTKRILTGIRPTGALHLGHYVGALKQWVELQKDYECFFLIADIQALTTHADKPSLIEEAVREVMLDFIAVGLDPHKENVNFVLQSGIRELTELTIYLSMITPFHEMERNPTIKAELKQMDSEPTVGFMVYPISQAADILLFTPPLTPAPFKESNQLLVPVGEDQVPHLEETNKIARRFNQRYRPVFLECTAKVGEVGRLPGLYGPDQKMSKSLRNAIFLKDGPSTVKELVSQMFTDPRKQRRGDSGHPQKCPVYLYYKVFGERDTLRGRDRQCRKGTLGCVECKQGLAEALNAFLEPIRERRLEAEKMPLADFLREGTKKAQVIGQATMLLVRKAMHLDYPLVFKS